MSQTNPERGHSCPPFPILRHERRIIARRHAIRCMCWTVSLGLASLGLGAIIAQVGPGKTLLLALCLAVIGSFIHTITRPMI